jgi:hypothetical protein
VLFTCGAPEGMRTPNLLIRSNWQSCRWRSITRSAKVFEGAGGPVERGRLQYFVAVRFSVRDNLRAAPSASDCAAC